MKKHFEGTVTFSMFITVLTLGIIISPVIATYSKPHIVMVVADDLGWDDVSFHGSNQIPTPTLDRLAKEGVILNNYYVSPLSTPSRAAFMTGKYASRLGVQHDAFHNQQPAGVPLTETFLPNRLRELGYSAHGVGKWHLGFFAKEYTPTYRGFDSFFGFWTNTEDYYSHVSYDNGYGLDLRRNLQLVYNETGTYSTEMFTKEAREIINRYDGGNPLFLYVAHQAVHVGNGDDPLQVPEKYVKQFAEIKDRSRRTFAGMVTTLDESLQKITDALTAKGMIENTILVFTSDNGGAAGGYDNSAGSNYPLRGSKNTFWEGGVRGVGFVYSPLLKQKGRICEELIHASDWLPTLYAAGGGNILSLGKIDGYNVWDALSDGAPSPRFEVLHGVDTLTGLSGALRVGDYKLIVNQDERYYGDWYPRPGVPIPKGQNKRKRRQLLEGTSVDCTIREPHPLLFTHAPVCKPREKPCLFNIKWDPCEYHNIAEIMPNTMKVMLERFNYFANSSAIPIYPESDNSSRPDLHDGSWTFWRDNPQIPQTNSKFIYPDPMADLKMNDHGGSSTPYIPPDNEKIFKEKAKHAQPFANLTRNTTVVVMKPHNLSEHSQPSIHHVEHHHDHGKSPLSHPPSQPRSPPPPPLPAAVHHVAPKPIHQTPIVSHHPHIPPVHHKDQLQQSSVQRVRPDVIIEGIGNLINVKPPAKQLTPTEAPVVPVATESPNIQYIETTNNPYSAAMFSTTETPSIDIQNMLMDGLGSGFAPTISPTEDYALPTKEPSTVQSAKSMKPLSLGDVVSGKPAETKTPGDKTLGSKFESHVMKIDLPQVYDVIDETENLSNNQESKGTTNMPGVYDVIDMGKQGIKAASKQQPSNKVESEIGSGKPVPSPLSTFFTPTSSSKPHVEPVTVPMVVQAPGRISPVAHNFEGDIVMDGHKFHIKGTETGDTEWLMNDERAQKTVTPSGNKDMRPVTAQVVRKPKNRVPSAEKKPTDTNNPADSHSYSEVTDVIDETSKYQGHEVEKQKPKDSVNEKPKHVVRAEKDMKKFVMNRKTKKVPVSHVQVNTTDITKKNDTNCEKPVQLESSDNAVVVSSVVIVVIASAMVVGVALVAMIAVVARHFQRPKNRDGGGTS